MTTFTDDLENDLEVLAEHHDVTQVQVAKAAFAQVPEFTRLALLRSMLEALEESPRDVQKRTLREKLAAKQQGPTTLCVKPPTVTELIDGEEGTVLVTVEGGLVPRTFDYVDAEGVRTRYTRPVDADFCRYEFGADGRSRMYATYSKEVIG